MERVLFSDISFGRIQEVLMASMACLSSAFHAFFACICSFWSSYLVCPTEQINMLSLAFSLQDKRFNAKASAVSKMCPKVRLRLERR